ncbi:MAG: M20/M25/M40 family metallo-hydrolase [Anaerolineales bacterium]
MDDVALLEGLLRIYSPTGQEAGVVDYLVAQMRAAGLEAFVDEAGNAVGMCGQGPQPAPACAPSPLSLRPLRGGQGVSEAEGTVMLLGHIDTVPGFIPVARDGDRLNGRGAVDAKGPLACFVAAAARFAGEHIGSSPRFRLVVIGAVGEEGDSRGAHFIKDRYRPACTVIGEPSGWEKITLGYKGSAWFEYRAQRALAHTSAQNESACEAAVKFWNRVSAWAEARNLNNKMFDQVNPTLRGMQSDSDGFVESAALRFGARLPPGLSVSALDDAVRNLLDCAELTLLEGAPAYRAEKNTPLVRAFLAAIRKAGGSPSFSLKSGTSDMNVVGPAWGAPIVAYGPGDSSLDHTPEEHILISEYQRAIGVLTDALLGLAL